MLIIHMDTAAQRWPRLMRAAQWVAILNRSEASGMLRDWARGYREGGCEAVAHFGGPRRVLSEAIRVRATVRQMYRGTR